MATITAAQIIPKRPGTLTTYPGRERPTVDELPPPPLSVVESVQPSPVDPAVASPQVKVDLNRPGSGHGLGTMTIWNEMTREDCVFPVTGINWECGVSDEELPRMIVTGVDMASGAECTATGWGYIGTGSTKTNLTLTDVSYRSLQVPKWVYTGEGSTYPDQYVYTANDWATCASTFAAYQMNRWCDSWGRMESDWGETKVDPKNRLREIIRSRTAPRVLTGFSGRTVLKEAEDVREACARATLRRVVGEDQYRRFLSHGFVSVRAKSGKVYQIRPGGQFTNVYENGKRVETLCVVFTKGQFPPTDSLIMRYLIILNDEEEFRKTAIKHSVSGRTALEAKRDDRRLTEVFAELKKLAA